MILIFLRDIDISEDSLDDEIPVDISTFSMNKIKEFFEHHEYKDIKPIRKPIKTSNYITITSEWDNNFFTSLDEDQISDLVMVCSCFL